MSWRTVFYVVTYNGMTNDGWTKREKKILPSPVKFSELVINWTRRPERHDR